MSVTFEEAYSSANSLYDTEVVSSCFENNDEWIFCLRRVNPPKSLIPGDWSSPLVINKSDGAVTRLSDRLGEGFKGLLKFKPLERGYRLIDIPAPVCSAEPVAAFRMASA